MVEALPAARFLGDQPGLAQHLEVLGDGRAAEVEAAPQRMASAAGGTPTPPADQRAYRAVHEGACGVARSGIRASTGVLSPLR